MLAHCIKRKYPRRLRFCLDFRDARMGHLQKVITAMTDGLLTSLKDYHY